MDNKLILVVGDIVALIGILVCMAAGLGRLMGNHYLMGFESITLFVGGISLMVMGCLAKLHFICPKR